MEVLNDYPWCICRKEEGMAIRGLDSRKIDSTSYTPAHVKSVIKSLGLNIVGETSNDFLCFCPFHSNRHTSSFSVSREKGAYICFNPSCGESGTLNDLVKKVLSKNEFESLRYIASKESESVENFDEVLEDMFKEKPDFVEFSQDTLNQLYDNLQSNSHAQEYFKHRGINEESMNYFKLGYSSNMGMVIVPVHSPDGMPVGLVGRSISELNLLNRYFNRIILMTDSDLAGRELGSTISSKLKNKDILWASHSYGKIYPNNAKDAGDMSDEEIIACIKNAVSDIEYRTWNL